jgi:hypothetical protein
MVYLEYRDLSNKRITIGYTKININYNARNIVLLFYSIELN